jgi:hypothetical protein
MCHLDVYEGINCRNVGDFEKGMCQWRVLQDADCSWGIPANTRHELKFVFGVMSLFDCVNHVIFNVDI